MPFSAVLLDCDGTVVPYIELLHKKLFQEATIKLHQVIGIPFDEDLFTTVWNANLGAGIEVFFRSYKDNLPPEDVEKLDDFCPSVSDFQKIISKIVNIRYWDIVERVTVGQEPEKTDYGRFFQIRPGLRELIEAAQSRNIPVAVISNAGQFALEATLKASGIKNIDLVLGKDTVEDAGYEPKPAGGSYLYGCALLGVNPEDALGVEDTLTGFKSLIDAGVGTTVFCRNDEDVSVPAVRKCLTIYEPDIILSHEDSVYQAVKDYLSGQSTPQQRPPLDPSSPAAPQP